jgi:hypothetical protein
MPRALTPRAVLESQRENSGDVFLVLLTIYLKGDPAEDIRVVNNVEDVVSRGNKFLACPFGIALPDDLEYASTSARLTLDNVDPAIWQGVRLLGFAPDVGIEVVLASEPDNVVLSTVGLKLREASATKSTVTGTLVPDTIWQSGYPEGDFDPPQNPGMFAS